MDILVEEIMTRSPVIAGPEASAHDVSMLMIDRKVGGVVIVEGGGPIGILTERDFLVKVVSMDIRPSDIKVDGLMSTPLVTIGPKKSVQEAARTMASLRIKRLPVVEEGLLIGIITEHDILRLSPSLIEVTREWSKLKSSAMSSYVPSATVGYCESCRLYSNQLRDMDGRLLCPDCFEDLE